MYKTQYIAPLRVKLDPARSDDATINYLSQPDRDLVVDCSSLQMTEAKKSKELQIHLNWQGCKIPRYLVMSASARMQDISEVWYLSGEHLALNPFKTAHTTFIFLSEKNRNEFELRLNWCNLHYEIYDDWLIHGEKCGRTEKVLLEIWKLEHSGSEAT